MSPKHLAIIDGYPDPDLGRFVHALAESYTRGAAASGHDLRHIEVAELEFLFIRSHRRPIFVARKR
ncbi:hypothetical protein MOK15_20580 [Sphingobium sp. BYY-5]|uniref:hypothetical protein n=1 Tax=Sphingobium sp. BYY-5 TaxID=2926400 RepID=UPI001FA6FE0E|nr:hypothetical protein [Sphingobium sp. BYY-5]MCI4592463.1 hypothetical protein [Sphingobium sp. BYY-5]